MDFALIVKLGLAALTCIFAVFAIVSEYRSNDIDRDDRPRLKELARFGTYSAVVCGILALAVTGIDGLLRPGDDSRVARAERSAPRSAQPPVASPDVAPPAATSASPPPSAPIASSPAPLPTFPVSATPPPPPPTFQSGTPNQVAPPTGGGGSYQWDSPQRAGFQDRDDVVAERRPPKVVFPYTPVTFTVVLRFSSDDPAIRKYVNRVVHQAEQDSGIALTRSSDKFASLRITPGDEVVYADGKQARLAKPKNYVAGRGEESAEHYLFNPQVHVTLAQPSGAQATFSKQVTWAGVRRDHPTDMLELYVFPQRRRVVLTVTAVCPPLQGQFPDGAPSVYDLRGGTVAAQLVKVGDVAEPKVVDLDDVDRHGADESNRLTASLAPRVRPTIVKILCATSPAGTVELGVDDATIQRSSLDRESAEVCGPVALVGFPAEPPPPR
ncbi:MAG: hypothetical protein ACYC96_14520 [Fimbriimonadaceae bacterium]